MSLVFVNNLDSNANYNNLNSNNINANEVNGCTFNDIQSLINKALY